MKTIDFFDGSNIAERYTRLNPERGWRTHTYWQPVQGAQAPARFRGPRRPGGGAGVCSDGDAVGLCRPRPPVYGVL